LSEIWYGRKEDVLGIQLKGKNYWKSVEVSSNVVVDLSDDGDIIAIEILGAKRSFKKDAPLIVSKVSKRNQRSTGR
jgi:uncharacterized protein YuzE